jgi:hypothetical protein
MKYISYYRAPHVVSVTPRLADLTCPAYSLLPTDPLTLDVQLAVSAILRRLEQPFLNVDSFRSCSRSTDMAAEPKLMHGQSRILRQVSLAVSQSGCRCWGSFALNLVSPVFLSSYPLPPSSTVNNMMTLMIDGK